MASPATHLHSPEGPVCLDRIDGACFDLALELDHLPPCSSLLALRDRDGRPLESSPFDTPLGSEEILRTRGFRMLYARALELGFDLRLQCSAALDCTFSRRWFVRITPIRQPAG
ncbi:MAG: hypothetical protein D6786_10110 [Gammaproteobacteria bacterium]|nr:MAG: hypothetical protein D6786_10110 [Gammaproteobacteria bacterium]